VGKKDGRAVEIDVGAREGLVGLLVKSIDECETVGSKDGPKNEVALGPAVETNDGVVLELDVETKDGLALGPAVETKDGVALELDVETKDGVRLGPNVGTKDGVAL
jgi:hypothetical protein